MSKVTKSGTTEKCFPNGILVNDEKCVASYKVELGDLKPELPTRPRMDNPYIKMLIGKGAFTSPALDRIRDISNKLFVKSQARKCGKERTRDEELDCLEEEAVLSSETEVSPENEVSDNCHRENDISADDSDPFDFIEVIMVGEKEDE